MEWFKIKSEKYNDLLVVNNFIRRVDRIYGTKPNKHK